MTILRRLLCHWGGHVPIHAQCDHWCRCLCCLAPITLLGGEWV